jgi:hypothetical protein
MNEASGMWKAAVSLAVERRFQIAMMLHPGGVPEGLGMSSNASAVRDPSGVGDDVDP